MFYICGFQGTVHNRISMLSFLFVYILLSLFLTDVLSVITYTKSLLRIWSLVKPAIQTALPRWCGLHLLWCRSISSPFPRLFFWGSRQPPAFPCRLQHSIIGRFSLNRRVRDGYGCFPEAHRHRKSFVINFFFDNSTVKHIYSPTY